jgi:hypothetical protein
MLLTSQNRNSVFQATCANGREVVLAAVVAHRPSASKRHLGMRRTRRPLGCSMRPDPQGSCYRPESGNRLPPVGCGTGLTLHPRLWASLVLCKMARG